MDKSRYVKKRVGEGGRKWQEIDRKSHSGSGRGGKGGVTGTVNGLLYYCIATNYTKRMSRRRVANGHNLRRNRSKGKAHGAQEGRLALLSGRDSAGLRNRERIGTTHRHILRGNAYRERTSVILTVPAVGHLPLTRFIVGAD